MSFQDKDRIDALLFQIELLERNIDLLDSNYRTLLESFDTSNIKLLKLPESLKPKLSLQDLDFKIIKADEGQDLSHREIKLNEI